MNPYQQLKIIFKRISHLQYAQRILLWDEAVMMPEGAGKSRAHAIATLNRAMQKMLINKKIKLLIERAKEQHNLHPWDIANLAWMETLYIRAACIPLELTERLTNVTLTCEQVWRKFRSQNNWHDFLPYLEQSFAVTKELADRRSQVLNLAPYDALIDEYAPGFDQKAIDVIFTKLKNSIPSLLQEIIAKQKGERVQNPVGPFPIDKQKSLCLNIMEALKFDFQHGRLDVSHHPFCSGGPRDVRITTRYSDDTFFSSLLGVCHETGHALYEQGLPRKWLDQPVGKVNSMAMHESQSLLIEMEICRSPAFFEYLTPLIQEHFGKQEAFYPDNLYKLATRVKPGLVRVDADEVTYPLHVILRYEIEKGLFSGDIAIKDLPEKWNDLMTTYLGISTKDNYQDGVMQDVHWPAGAFGYFPAYTLGRLIASQIFATFTKSHAQFHENIRGGVFQSLHDWLKENIYSSASLLTVNDLLIKVTDQSLNIDYFIKHIKQRYLI